MLIFTSIPKSGTHLVRSVLEQLLGPPGSTLAKTSPWKPRRPWTFCAHVRFAGQALPRGAKVMVLVRDPRAIVLSLRDFILDGAGRSSVHPSIVDLLETLPLNEQVRRIAEGVRTPHARISPIARHCSGFTEWPGAVVVRYEQFFTPAGARMVHACLPNASISRIQQAIDRSIGADTTTYSVGDPDRWRWQLELNTIRAIEAAAGPVMSRFGYAPVDGTDPLRGGRAAWSPDWARAMPMLP